GLRDLRRLCASGELRFVVEPRELHVRVTSLERPLQQAIREPGVLRQTRAVEVAADHSPLDGALGLVLAVVAVADHDAAERHGPWGSRHSRTVYGRTSAAMPRQRARWLRAMTLPLSP